MPKLATIHRAANAADDSTVTVLSYSATKEEAVPGAVADGTAVLVLSETASLAGLRVFKVRVEAREGFIKTEHIKVAVDGSAIVRRKDLANAALRNTAQEGSTFVNGAIAPGTAVQVIDGALPAGGEFVRVRTKAREGYVHAAHIKLRATPKGSKRSKR